MAAVAASRFALFKSRFLWPHLSFPLSASHPKLWHGLCERIKQAAASSVCSKERQSRGRKRGSMFPYAVSVFISTGRQTNSSCVLPVPKGGGSRKKKTEN